jgi:hypothetical protein
VNVLTQLLDFVVVLMQVRLSGVWDIITSALNELKSYDGDDRDERFKGCSPRMTVLFFFDMSSTIRLVTLEVHLQLVGLS